MSAHAKIYYFTCSALASLVLLLLAACGDNTATVAPVATATTGVTPTTVAATATTAPPATTAAVATTAAATTAAVAANTTIASNTSSDALDPAKVETGHKVFVAQCQLCHLNGGKSSGGAGPNLAFSRKATDPEKVRTNIRNGVDAMPAFDTTKISDAELEGIVLYLKSIHQN